MVQTPRGSTRPNVRFAATPDLERDDGRGYQFDTSRTSRVARTPISVAAPGTVDPKSNYTSSDNPLAPPAAARAGATLNMTSRRAPAIATAPPGTVDAKSNYTSTDNPLAPAPRASFAHSHSSSGASSSGAPYAPTASSTAVRGPRTVTVTGNDAAPARAAPELEEVPSRRFIATVAPGSVSTKSNFTSSDNPLAATGYVPVQRPNYDEPELLKFAAAPGAAPPASNIASADNPLVPVHKLGGGKQPLKVYSAKKASPWVSTSSSSLLPRPAAEVEFVKFAAAPGTAPPASNIASADNPLVPIIKVVKEQPMPQQTRVVKLVPRG